MSWRTIVYPLTKQQKRRGVVYSSELVVSDVPDLGGVIHEVMADDPDKERKISNLEEVTFFKNIAEDMGWKVINKIHK